MQKIIISSYNQFGYLIDTFKYCSYLNDIFDITYICFDEGREKININNVKVIYVKKKKNIIFNYLNLNYEVIKQSYKNKIKKIFCVYNPLAFLQRIFLINRKIILDIRTGSVDKDINARKKANRRIKINSIFFNDITVISESLAKKLEIKKYRIIPLGADNKVHGNIINTKKLKMIYVGILNNRNIIHTVKGFNKFIDESGCYDAEYKIIGYFNKNDNEKTELLNEIMKSKNIEYLGEKNHEEAMKLILNSNVGVSYVPITEYYNFQPPTKTYEYMMNGLVTIATATYENKKIVKEGNGVLCDDNINSFTEAIKFVKDNLDKYNSNYIRECVKNNSWENIALNIVKPILE